MRPSRALLLLLAAATATATQHSLHERSNRPSHLAARQLLGFGDGDDSDSTTSATRGVNTATARAAASASAAAASSSEAAAEASSSAAAAAASASASRAAAASASSDAAAASASAASDAAAASSSAAAAASASAAASRSAATATPTTSSSRAASTRTTVSLELSTDAEGLTVTRTATVIATDVADPTSSVPLASATAASSDDSNGSHTGLIIGAPVAGGVVLIAALIFLYIKFGPKRDNYEDGDADIKWPELKTDPDSNVMQPLPARRTGGAGFDMGDDSDNEGHDGMEKGRESFSGSTTGLAHPGVAGAYGITDYPPGPDYPPTSDHGYSMHQHADSLDPAYAMHHQTADAQYYDQDLMYAQQQQQYQQYPMHMQPNQAYSETNPYGADPYSHAGMQEQPHHGVPRYQHNNYL